MAQDLAEVRSDCARFLGGLSYEVEVGDGILRAKKGLHNRVDEILVKFLFDTPENSIPRDQWEGICDEFERAGKVGKYLIVREGVAITSRHVAEASKRRFIALTFPGFLSRFAKLDDLREQIKKKLREEEQERAAHLMKTPVKVFVEPYITVSPDGTLHRAMEYLTQYWDGSSGLLVLLAPPGHGKSTLSAEITRRLLSTSSIPILIPFADYRRLVDFPGLVFNFFVKHRHDALSPDALAVVLKYNLATIILDGFDELCETAGISTARENLNAVCNGIDLGGKVLLTSRTAFFRSVMSGSDRDRLKWEEAHLEPFDPEQRLSYIRQRTDVPEPSRAKLTTLLSNVPTADQLASSPLVLSELCDMADDVAGGSPLDKGIAHIYRWLLDRHCAREVERQSYDVVPELQIEILSEIAEWGLLDIGEDSSSQKTKAEYVEGIIRDHLEQRRTYDPDTVRKLIPKLLGHALLNVTKTNNADERYIRFLHHTWHDYLIARQICEFSAAGKGDSIAEILSNYRVLPEYVAIFIADMLDEKNARALLAYPEIRTRKLFSQALRIAQEFAKKLDDFGDLEQQRFLSLLGIESFAGRDIWQAQFVYLPLSGVSFRNTVMSDTTFRKCDLRRADFSGSTLRKVAFDNCDLEKAIFDTVKEMSPQDKIRASSAGAVVDGVDAGDGHRLALASDLVRQALMKFRQRASHLTESVWRRGFSPVNQRRVREVVIPRLTRYGYLEITVGSKETLHRVEAKMGIWLSWAGDSSLQVPAVLAPVVEEIKTKIWSDGI
jgi:hypothetical protein